MPKSNIQQYQNELHQFDAYKFSDQNEFYFLLWARARAPYECVHFVKFFLVLKLIEAMAMANGHRCIQITYLLYDYHCYRANANIRWSKDQKTENSVWWLVRCVHTLNQSPEIEYHFRIHNAMCIRFGYNSVVDS